MERASPDQIVAEATAAVIAEVDRRVAVATRDWEGVRATLERLERFAEEIVDQAADGGYEARRELRRLADAHHEACQPPIEALERIGAYDVFAPLRTAVVDLKLTEH